MPRINMFVLTGCLLCLLQFAHGALIMNEIVGPDSVENGSTDELILDCDFEAKGEDDVVLKWFYNGMEDQIYQWIALNKNAYAMGSLRNLIDPTYKISDDPNSMMRALRFKDVNSTLSGNYTCKVDTDDEVKWLTKQVIVYSPATSFQIFLIGVEDQFQGDEVVLCEATNISPRPDFSLHVSGSNGSLDDLEIFNPIREEIPNDDDSYNVSIRISFNSSYLEPGTTKFTCLLSIPGTNYSDTRSMEHFVDNEEQHSSFELSKEEYPSLNYPSNLTEERPSKDIENGSNRVDSVVLLVCTLLFSLFLTT